MKVSRRSAGLFQNIPTDDYPLPVSFFIFNLYVYFYCEPFRNIKMFRRKSLAAQWLRLCASIAGGTGSIPGWGTKIPQAAQPKKKKKRERERIT